MRVVFDPSVNAMYVYPDNLQPVVRTAELAPGILADYDDRGIVVGLEILGGPLTLVVKS